MTPASRTTRRVTRPHLPDPAEARPGSPEPAPAQAPPAKSRVDDRFSTGAATGSEGQALRAFTHRAGGRSPHATSAARPAARAQTNPEQGVQGRVRRGLAGTREGMPARAEASPGAPPGYAGSPQMGLGDAAKVLQKHLAVLDTAAGGRRDGVFGLADLQAVAADGSQPRELRDVARALLADVNQLNALDVAGGPRLDRRFSARDTGAVVREEAQNAGGMSLAGVTAALGRNAGLDSKGRERWSAFDALDAASTGRLDGRVSRQDCQRVADDAGAPPGLRQVARALLDNDNLFRALDVARADRLDGRFSREDLKNVSVSPTPEAGRQWSAADEKALDAVLARRGPFPDLYRGVYQTDRGNCASTAVIKAAMDTWGTDVFRAVEKEPGGAYRVEMKDGTRVHLSREELEAAATGAHYRGDDAGTRAFATLCYAAMARRAQMIGHEGSATYAEALRSLANGEMTAEVPRYLGLADQVKRIDVGQIRAHDGVVAWGNGHAVFVDEKNGAHFTDAWGQARAFDGTNEVDKPDNALQHAFYFVA